jgi:dinuclear metal center YbgI/SA1388 family protein
MKICEVISYLESIVPVSSQESYDNCGLLIGDRMAEVKGVLLCLDSTEEVVDEAIRIGANIIIAHHPIIFKGLKSITGKNYVERTLLACIKNDIALYTIHTNLDNYRFGVNKEICDRLGLSNTSILFPKSEVLYKLVVFVPEGHHATVSNAIFVAGAGEIGNYNECQFFIQGTGTYRPIGAAQPFSGEMNELSSDPEIRAEFLVPAHKLGAVIAAMKYAHPYEEVAHDIYLLKNSNQTEGSGMVGYLNEPLNELDFLQKIKETFSCASIRYTSLTGRKVSKVAVCGGSGSFLLKNAIASGADFFITGDFKYHEFFDAEGKLVVADIGHYESEQFTPNLLAELLKKKFTTFAVRLTEVNTNPINYF